MLTGFRPTGRRVVGACWNAFACLICAATFLATAQSLAADTDPLPRQRPDIVPAERTSPPGTDITPSACQLRLGRLAIFSRSPPITGPGECMATDVVTVDAVVLPDKHNVAFRPSLTLRCPMAEAVAQWVANDVVPAVAAINTSLRTIETLSSFECRPRNSIPGERLSEHGRGNALDVRSFKLANGAVIELTNAHVSKSLRERVRDSACERFSTVLGNGADAYHNTHVHLDLMERGNHYRICQWDVLDPDETAALEAKKAAAPTTRLSAVIREEGDVPLPRSRPVIDTDAVKPWRQSVPRIFKERAIRTQVALSLALSSGPAAMTYAEEQTVTVGPWAIGTSYKGDNFDGCSMSRSTGELGITFFRAQGGLLLLLESQKWRLERGKAYPVRIVAGGRSVEAKALAESKAVTIALVDGALTGRLRTADVLEVRGEGATLRVPLDGSMAALGRLETCFDKNSRGGVDTNPFVSPSHKP